RAMVTVYGLNEKVGNLTYHDSSGQSEYNFTKPYSEKTSELIDKEISNLIEEQYQRAIKLLEENKDKLTKLAEILLEKEVIFKDNLEEIFGKRPFKSRDEIMSGNSQERKVKVEEETVTEKSVPENTDPSAPSGNPAPGQN
ncbi:MAG: peptidase M41, partial [Salinimicrobium sediminis]|nr:peptidase M41 [Salinimicrobium sediminis]